MYVQAVTGHNTFRVKGDVRRIFDYSADFSHIHEWDPGTVDSHSLEKDSKPGLDVGSKKKLTTVMLGLKTPCVYQILEVDKPKQIKYFSTSRYHQSWDTVTFRQVEPDEVEVDYHTKMELKNWFKVCEPFSAPILLHIAKEAADGLEAKLKELKGEVAPVR
ncbi:hypothetical protein WJX72_003838 [[Myrmecia] bisecta]|uniref:Uncharacterized protein n=1 Tax=[Myrmecia] bisecta TaxID=41462 RepID=A0AAW1Q7L3_9CHLO